MSREAATAKCPINIWIKNAGVGYFRRFDEADWTSDVELMQVNITSLVGLARCFVENILEGQYLLFSIWYVIVSARGR